MAKLKKVSYRLIPDDAEHAHMHRLLNELIIEHHAHLKDARIALAWHKGWTADKDGRVTLGKCKRATDLDRQLAKFDFVIILNREFWTHPDVTEVQRRALVDHELYHAEIARDDASEPIEDETGRIVYRIRKHDIEEFASIVERYGCYKHDLENFAAALFRSPQQQMFAAEKEERKKRAAPVKGQTVSESTSATH